jgi:heterotetrameric sarcosine oxidase gamma subunit
MAEADFSLVREDCAIVQADGWAANLAAFEADLSRQLGCSLPRMVGETVALGQGLIVRIAPARFWIIGEGPKASRLSFEPELGSVVSLGEGRVRLRLAGSRLFDVLASCVAIDWLSPAAAVGQAVQTGFHRIPVLFLRSGQHECDLIVPRSFAKSLSDWLADVAAGLEQPTAKRASR